MMNHDDPSELSRVERAVAAGFSPDEPCLSGWTGDRCSYGLFHEGPHSNEQVHSGQHELETCVECRIAVWGEGYEDFD